MTWRPVLIGFAILASLAVGVWWQKRVFARREERSRSNLKGYKPENFPNYIAFGVCFCYAAFAAFVSLDKAVTTDTKALWTHVLMLFGLAIVFSLKNTFAPLIFGISLSIASYKFLTHGTFNPAILYDLTSEVFLAWTPKWIQHTYANFSLVCSLAGATFGILSDGVLERVRNALPWT